MLNTFVMRTHSPCTRHLNFTLACFVVSFRLDVGRTASATFLTYRIFRTFRTFRDNYLLLDHFLSKGPSFAEAYHDIGDPLLQLVLDFILHKLQKLDFLKNPDFFLLALWSHNFNTSARCLFNVQFKF